MYNVPDCLLISSLIAFNTSSLTLAGLTSHIQYVAIVSMMRIRSCALVELPCDKCFYGHSHVVD